MNPLAQTFGFEPVPGEQSAPAKTEKIGRFELVEELGKGSMGVVYLARDPMIGRWVAVKKLTGIKGKDLDPGMVRRLLINEARNAGALEHPSIVTVFDIVEDRDGEVEALAMEFVGGRSLRQRLDDPEPISLKYIGEILSAVAEALDYAHANGCIHRDVKPANILLGNDGVIKIADFGIAALRGEDLASELRNLGTPNYLAPERVLGQPGDQRTDIYSLGVILYELLTRHLPFEATSIAELVKRIVQEEPTPAERFVPELMPGLKVILARSIAKQPEDRFETAGALAAGVREIIEAQAALNDTVPTPFPVKPNGLNPMVSGPKPELLSPPELPPERTIEPTVAAPIEELLKLPLEAEKEEVEWESAVTVAPAPSRQDEVRAAVLVALEKMRTVSRKGLQSARSLAPPVLAVVRRGAAAVRERPAVAAVAAFVAALPVLLLAFGGGGEAKAVGRSGGEAMVVARRQVASLLAESRAQFAAGNTRAAQDALHQADLLFPVKPEGGMSRILLAAEREVDRLDRVDQVVQQAHLEIARADFRRAKASIEKLVELEAPEETLGLLESSLVQAHQRVRRARQARALEPEVADPVPAFRPVPVVSVPKTAPKTGPGTLRIEFSSARPRGVLVVFSDDRQVLNRSYRFVEKKNLFVRKGVSGSFQESLELPEGTRNIRLYLTQPKQPTQLRPITVEIPPGESSTLRLRVQADGKLVVGRG